MNNPYQPISLEKATRIAQKRNARHRSKYPLLAAHWPGVTPAQVQQEYQRHHDRFQAVLERLQAVADQFRSMVAALVTAAEMERLDERRLLYPNGVEYSASFWRAAYQRLKGGQ
jgi:hypothetical protein